MADRGRERNTRGTRLRVLITSTAVTTVLVGALVSPADAGNKSSKSSTSTTTSTTTTVAPAAKAAAPAQSMALGSMFSVVDQIGARALWAEGITGAGVNVAVIDTGVADVAELSGRDKVVAMVDLSAEAGVPEARFADTYGHGAHMAGSIAGRIEFCFQVACFFWVGAPQRFQPSFLRTNPAHDRPVPRMSIVL